MLEADSPPKTRYTREDFQAFLKLSENVDKWFEFIDGEIYELTPPSHRHSRIVTALFKLLVNFSDTHQLGEVFGDGTGYNLPDGTTLVPDVSFITAGHVPAINSPLDLAPDLAVEVVSPSHTESDMRRKIRLYLNNGTRRVWMVYPDERVVVVHQKAADGSVSYRELREDQTLGGDDLLPGFNVVVLDLFPKG